MDRGATRNLNEECLTDWVRQHADSLRGYLWSLTRDAPLAEDLLQETFLRVWRQRADYVEQGKERAYLFRIADRLVIDNRRRQAIRKTSVIVTDSEDDGQEQPIEGVLRDERREQLDAAMKNLSPIQQRVLSLRYFGELPFEEIASVVGCPLGTALSHVHRGLEQLRKILAKSGR